MSTQPASSWECHKCHAVNAPHVAQCPCSVVAAPADQTAPNEAPDTSSPFAPVWKYQPYPLYPRRFNYYSPYPWDSGVVWCGSDTIGYALGASGRQQ